MPEEIRTAELTADALGRTVRVETGDRTFLIGRAHRLPDSPGATVGWDSVDRTFLIGRLVRIRHKLVRDETQTRIDLEVLGDQRISVGFNAIGVVDLL